MHPLIHPVLHGLSLEALLVFCSGRPCQLSARHALSLQGLDPASRRNLWDVIKRQRAGRGIILTTHNMEEAEVRSA